jgi:hypothetical protein
MRTLALVIVVVIAASAAAQQRPIFDPDDFLDPRTRGPAVFISRLVLGVARNSIDDYRPLHQDAGFLHLTSSFYWSAFQFDYDHTEMRGETSNGPARVQMCPCVPPIYFPTPPPLDATPAAPLPGPKDTLLFGWYHTVGAGPAQPPVMLRYRLRWSRQKVDTIATLLDTKEIAQRLSGHEQSIGIEADTLIHVGGHALFGSLTFARTTRRGTTDDRTQNDLAYTARFPALPVKGALFRATVTVGGISGRGATGLNLVNPAFEAFWHDWTTQANVHLVWSPLTTRSGTGGWETHHQIALFIDRALYVKRFRR